MAARAEAAVGAGMAFGQVLVDMVKAFDHVPHWVLVQEARALHYPLHLLRLSLAAYTLPRVINIGGVFSRVILACRGLTAGPGLATTGLRALLIRALDRVTNCHPSPRL